MQSSFVLVLAMEGMSIAHVHTYTEFADVVATRNIVFRDRFCMPLSVQRNDS